MIVSGLLFLVSAVACVISMGKRPPSSKGTGKQGNTNAHVDLERADVIESLPVAAGDRFADIAANSNLMAASPLSPTPPS
jgi:hypothetical protein